VSGNNPEVTMENPRTLCGNIDAWLIASVTVTNGGGFSEFSC
jgi:hypothetical protein